MNAGGAGHLGEALDALAIKDDVIAYVGYDCTAPSLHIGHLLSIMMLHWLQQTGNKPIALILYVSNPYVFHAALAPLTRHLLFRRRLLATMAELHVVGRAPWLGVNVHSSPRMYRSAALGPEHFDYLYSELTCVPW